MISTSDKDKNVISPHIHYIDKCKVYFVGFEFPEASGNTIKINIPTKILPLTIQIANNFHLNPSLVECNFELDPNEPWIQKPRSYQILNPIYGNSFSGSKLMQTRINKFFSSHYKPQESYNCQNYILHPTNPDIDKLQELVPELIKEGFTEKESTESLLRCRYDIDKTRLFLNSGIFEPFNFQLPISYTECPLFYLVIEICESFFDLNHCCCICGKKFGADFLMPTCCNNETCKQSFVNEGLGSSIINEIKRDQLATDLLISAVGLAFHSPGAPVDFYPSPDKYGNYIK